MTEAMSGDRLEYLRLVVAESVGTRGDLTTNESLELIAEVDRLRDALARVTDDSMAEVMAHALMACGGKDPWCGCIESWIDEGATALDAIRSVVAAEKEAGDER